ncbi:MAG: outer membrane protein assembly factor BamA [Paracoccaceae bacterium]
MGGTFGGTGRGTFGRRLLKPAVVAVLLGSTAVSGPFLTQAFAQSYAFSNVTVQGNQNIETQTILSYAGIKRGQSVSAGELNDAYQRIVNSGLFEKVELTPQGSTLVIRVVENPMINVVDFQGNKRVKDENLTKVIKSQSRRVYNPAQAEEDAANIAEVYRVQGRIAATVTPKIIRRDGNRVDLVFEITEGKVAEVERLSFVGNRAFSDRRLRQVLETKQAGFLRAVITRDTYAAERIEVDKQMLRDFYLSRGYIDVQVLDASAEVSRERDAYFVTFSIREGQSYRIGNVTTHSEVQGVDAAEFDAVRKLRTGVTYSPSIIDNNVTRMENLALRKGLNFIRVEPRFTRNDKNQTIDVDFVLTRGQRIFVERIDIEGNTTTLDEVVRRQFRTVEGDPFNPREVKQAAERIRALGFFKDAKVDAQPGSSADQVVVNVDVEEQPTGSLSFGASYGVNSGVGLLVGFSESNFLGRGQGLSLNISSGTDTIDSSFTFSEPAFLGRDLRFSFNAFYRETDHASAEYNTRRIGISPAISFPVGDLSRLELRYTVAKDTILDVDADNSSQILVKEEEVGDPLESSVGYTYSYDSRIGGLNPAGGIVFRFGQDFAGLGGDVKAITTTVFAMAEQRIWHEDVTVRAIFEGGAIHALGDYQTRVVDRYFGNGKIRGFDSNGIGPRDLNTPNEDALGGNLFAVVRLESDFPLGLPEEYGITGGLFLDAGSVWSLDNKNGGLASGCTAVSGDCTVDDSFHLRSAIGFSIFWTTPIGPLRFNFSKALIKEDYDQEQNFDLTISTKF